MLRPSPSSIDLTAADLQKPTDAAIKRTSALPASLEKQSLVHVPYRGDVDGLRAIAVVSVFMFHLGISGFSGGFVGVDIFFVISGYLIAQTIRIDLDQGVFSLGRFYERRIRRILPALSVMSLFCVLASAMVSPPQEMVHVGQSLIATTLFVNNIFIRYTGGAAGYFGNDSHSDIFLHTWSLSVEEQFYVIFPVALIFLTRRKSNVLKWLLVLGLASLIISIAWTELNQKEAFYFVFTRAWEFLIGSSIVFTRKLPLSESWHSPIAFVGLLLIGCSVYAYTDAIPFPGAAAVPPCVGSLLIIVSGERRLGLVGRLLASRPFVFVGLRSYSLYLWHWPMIVLVRHVILGDLTPAASTFIVIVAAGAAFLSHKYVERPFRRRTDPSSPAAPAPKKVVGIGAAICGGMVAVGLVIIGSGGLAARFDATTRGALAANIERKTDRPDASCENWRADVRGPNDINFCPLGDDRPKKFLFIGDSHVDGLRFLIKHLFDQSVLDGGGASEKHGVFNDHGALFAVSAGCPPLGAMTNPDPGYHCNAFFRLAFERARQSDIDTVFIGFSAWWDIESLALCASQDDQCRQLLSRSEAETLFIDGLRANLALLKRAGKRVIIMLPSPYYSESVPDYQNNRIILRPVLGLLHALGLAPPIQRFDFEPLRSEVIAVANTYGSSVFDPRKSVCGDRDQCVFQRNDVSIYSDSNHLALSQLSLYEKELRRSIEPPNARYR